MKRICCIAEGFGDVSALPRLIAKTGAHHGKTIISPDPIRAGSWPKIKRPGEIERLLDLAASRRWDHILFAVDLDDHCPVDECQLASERIAIWKNGRNILTSVVFFEKEYESLFLHDPQCFGDFDPGMIPNDPHRVRGAKEAVKRIIGRRYKETIDQVSLTEQLSVERLAQACRSFQKFQKEVLRET